MSERPQGFVAGVVLGCLLALVLIVFIVGCSKPDTGETWTPVTAGKWVVIPPERTFVVVEVKLDPSSDRFYMRISSVAIPKHDPTPDTGGLFALVTSMSMKLDPKRALDKTVGWIEATDEIPATHAWWVHECCDCSSTHRVLSIPTPEGLRMLWWKDDRETRKKRSLRGFESRPQWSDPWSAETP